MLLGRFSIIWSNTVTTCLKNLEKSGNSRVVREKSRKIEKVREMSEETVLGLRHWTQIVGTIFFCSLRSHIICTPPWICGAIPGRKQLLGLAGGLPPNVPVLPWCIVESTGKLRRFYVPWKVVTREVCSIGWWPECNEDKKGGKGLSTQWRKVWPSYSCIGPSWPPHSWKAGAATARVYRWRHVTQKSQTSWSLRRHISISVQARRMLTMDFFIVKC